MSEDEETGAVFLSKFGNPEIVIPLLSEIPLTQKNQRVIRYDCDRTRSSLELFRSETVRRSMEAILTFYCQSEKVRYIQGMNEVLAPFVYLKLVNVLPNWAAVYTVFKRFIDRYLPGMFVDEEFEHLQRMCVCFRTLLRYHAPSLASKLDNAGILPELYVTPWFLTLFGAKLKLGVLLEFWKRYVQKDDPVFFAFVGLSLMLGSVEELETSEKIAIPEKLTKLTITEDSLAQIWRRAEVLKLHTPQDLIGLLRFSDRPVLVPQLPHKIVPMYIAVSETLVRDENKKFIVLDTRPARLVQMHQCGVLPARLALPFDLEQITKGHETFPVCKVYQRVADIVGVDLSANAPFWPVQTHICILADENRRLVKRDYSHMLFLCLTRYCHIPRVSMVRGGFDALHALIGNRLPSHNPKLCVFCKRTSFASSSSSSSSDSS